MKDALILAIVLGTGSLARAQQPFYTDDADVTAKGKVHVESFDEYDWLQVSQLPHQQQNTVNMKINYGLGHGLELDLDSPLITIVNDVTVNPRRPFGWGDTNFGLKYNFREERPNSSLPAFAGATYIEVPTGNVSSGLGSGLTDVWVYGVAQKSIGRDIAAHLNGGYLFTGNTSTGVVGITTARGHVGTMGGSVVKKMSDTLTLGFDVTSAVTRNAALNRAQFQVMLGGNYSLREGLTLDAGGIVGHFAASPRVGLQIGFSWDVGQSSEAAQVRVRR
jgi:hypothetical protein